MQDWGELVPRLFGARVERREDAPLLTGRGQYVADIRLSGMLEAAFVRSHLAHAEIRGIDLGRARDSAGVVAALAAGDLSGVKEFPDYIDWQRKVRQFPLQRGRVRYVGAPVAVVVASNRYEAEDASELVEVDYEELPAVLSIEEALAPGAPRLFEEWPDNRVMDLPAHDAEVDRILASSPTVTGRYRVQRQAPCPMETRGVVAEFARGRLTVWSSQQSAHILRTTLATVLDVPERIIRVVTPDVGGGFGGKTHQYPEEIIVAWLAMRLRRPVRWIEDRAEHLVSAVQAREQLIVLEGSYSPDGAITALRAEVICDVGSGEIAMPGTCTSLVSAACLTAAWKIPRYATSVTCVVTNKTPSGAYRGFGAPEAALAIERFITKVALAAGVDPIEARRRMIFDPEDLPYVQPSGNRIDSGSHRAAFERAIELGRAALSKRQEAVWGDRVRLGLGYCQYVEPTAPSYFGTTGRWTAYDASSISVQPDGGVLVSCGVAAIGQGTETTIAAIAADALQVPMEGVTVLMGDTDSCPYGLGSWGSRSAVVFTGSVLKAAEIIRRKGVTIAASILEAAESDVVLEEGRFHVRGSPAPDVGWAEVATAACVRTIDLPPGVEPGLDSTVIYDPPNLDHRVDAEGRMNGAATWANASHSGVVAVDLDTGGVRVLDYIVVHDCGRVINPSIVDGQIHGGVAQGIAGALFENIAYDANGQPQTTSFMDYLLPSAAEMPRFVVEHFESPAPEMPLGLKGVGEAGTIGPGAVIANAVSDALGEFGVDITETPITNGSVLRALARGGCEP